MTTMTDEELTDLPGECWDALALLDKHHVTSSTYDQMLQFVGARDSGQFSIALLERVGAPPRHYGPYKSRAAAEKRAAELRAEFHHNAPHLSQELRNAFYVVVEPNPLGRPAAINAD